MNNRHNNSECCSNSTDRHPCFNFKSSKQYARIHLPVAPKCNIQCNFCNRKYDCVNESRPGVTSKIMTPNEAVGVYNKAKEKFNNISVVGFAGPGDSLANFENVRETVKLIRQQDNDVLFCLSTNGLMLPDYADEIINLGFTHVTVTINAVDREIISKIYEWYLYKGKKLNSGEGAELLLNNQLAGLKKLVAQGILCKINTLYLKGINDENIPEVVKTVKECGAFISNITKLIPAEDTKFQDLEVVTDSELNNIRTKCSGYLKQMYHCKQCRADAVGLLEDDKAQELY